MRLGKGYSQYYATVDLGATRVGRTRILEGQPKDPVWNETFRIYCAHMVPQITISIKDAAIVGTTVVGRAKVPAIELLSGMHFSLFQSTFQPSTSEKPSLLYLLITSQIKFPASFLLLQNQLHMHPTSAWHLFAVTINSHPYSILTVEKIKTI